MEKESVFNAYIRYSKGEFEFHVGWFWIAVGIALLWWTL